MKQCMLQYYITHTRPSGILCV